MDVQKLLTELFELQRFEEESALKSIIDETEERYFGTQLSDDILGKLSAAGDPYTQVTRQKKRNKKT